MDELNNLIENKKTDESKLEKVLKHYDLDEELELELDNIEKRVVALQVKYQTWLNTRRYLSGKESK